MQQHTMNAEVGFDTVVSTIRWKVHDKNDSSSSACCAPGRCRIAQKKSKTDVLFSTWYCSRTRLPTAKYFKGVSYQSRHHAMRSIDDCCSTPTHEIRGLLLQKKTRYCTSSEENNNNSSSIVDRRQTNKRRYVLADRL